ncbi:MAG: C40 family peptidase [Sulfuricurvum sp.]
MTVKWILIPLILLISNAQAESQRREPSLLLEYERELKKNNDSLKNDENPFSKHPTITSVSKPTPPTVPVVNAVTMNEPVSKKPLYDNDDIGKDANPYIIVKKTAPIASSTTCPDPVPADSESDQPHKSIIKHLSNVKEKLLSKAKEFLGTPYGFGGKDGDKTDCSGFTRQVYQQFGVSLPHSAAEQAQLGENVDPNDLQVGDLLFYRTYKSDPSHVAIYAGNGQIIHASYAAKKVQYDSIDKGYYKQRFMYAKRLALNSEYDE